MNENTAISNVAEQKMTIVTEFIERLKPADRHSFITQHKLEANKLLVNDVGHLYIPLQNLGGEIIGVKQLTGPQRNSQLNTNSDEVGYFEFVGDFGSLILLADDYLTAHKVHHETGYRTIMIAHHDDLFAIKDLLAPFKGEVVLVYCAGGSVVPKSQLVSLGIEIFDASSDVNFIRRMEEAVERASLRIPAGYELDDDGVYIVSHGHDGVETRQWICSPLKVSALTRDIDNKNWGRTVEVLDADKMAHTFAMPMTQVISSNFIEQLAECGLTFKAKYKSEVNEYLMKAQPLRRARCVSKTGWYKETFVFPNRVVGEMDEKVVYQNSFASNCNYDESGTLDEWQDNVASLCKGNTRLAFGVSAAFATMILHLVSGESGGFHFRGESSRGKTTILTLAKSVFGNPRNLPRWRATVNGLEGLAGGHNHSLLCLDEFGQLAEVNPKSAGEAIYMLGNGEGKQRMKSNNMMQNTLSWQLLYLSAGEVSLNSILARAGLQVRGGQEVRFIDLLADAGKNLGAFDTTHDSPDGNQFALTIKENAFKYYGTAAIAFLDKVTAQYEKSKKRVIDSMDRFMRHLDLTDADPQVYRVAHRFAQIAASGELASSFGVTGWEEGEANNAALACFESWINERGGNGSQEAKAALEQVSGKLMSLGLLRFNTAGQSAARNGPVWGVMDENFYYVYTNSFRDFLCEGLNVKAVEKALFDAEVLVVSKDRSTIQKKIENQNVRVYKIRKKILEFTSVGNQTGG